MSTLDCKPPPPLLLALPTVLLGPGTCGGGGSFSHTHAGWMVGELNEKKIYIYNKNKNGGKKFWGKGSSGSRDLGILGKDGRSLTFFRSKIKISPSSGEKGKHFR